eukprot:gene22563-29689_t
MFLLPAVMAFGAFLVLASAMVMRASAINCYTAYRQRNFTEIGIPAGTFFPFPDLEEEKKLYYRSCISYSVKGEFAPTFIEFPEYNDALVMVASGVDGQGAAEICSELLVDGKPTAAFMKYVYANEPIIAPEVATYECCAQDFCNGNIACSYIPLSSAEFSQPEKTLLELLDQFGDDEAPLLTNVGGGGAAAGAGTAGGGTRRLQQQHQHQQQQQHSGRSEGEDLRPGHEGSRGKDLQQQQGSWSRGGNWAAENEDPWPGSELATTQDWDPSFMADGDLANLDATYNQSKANLYMRNRDGAKPILRFHWAFISCERPMWSRIVSLGLISALTNDMFPTTITIIWCAAYNASSVPSLFHNIRFSRKIRVLYLPDKFKDKVQDMDVSQKNNLAMMRALSVPEYLNMPNLPILITEDDAMFTTDFNARLKSATGVIHKFLGRGPKRPNYLINLYRPSLPIPDYQTIAWYEGEWNKTDIPPEAGEIKVLTGGETMSYGVQGLLYTPVMARRMLRHVMDVFYGKYEFPGFFDMLVQNFLFKRFKCYGHNAWSDEVTPHRLIGQKRKEAAMRSRMSRGIRRERMVEGSRKELEDVRCVSFRIVPCMVQHTGLVSSVFQGYSNQSTGNARFHLAKHSPSKSHSPPRTSLAHGRLQIPRICEDMTSLAHGRLQIPRIGEDMIKHTSLVSSVFQGSSNQSSGNARFHLAKTFPWLMGGESGGAMRVLYRRTADDGFGLFIPKSRA